MEIIYFTAVAIALYLISDTILNRIEQARGAHLPHRSLIFFAIILILSLSVFSLLQKILPTETGPIPTQESQPAESIPQK
ncbi:MAG: hypothetical protein H7832_10095 [Magnetococcus sp. DMHC-6]